MVTDEEQPSRAVPAIPGHPLDSPLAVPEALRAGIGLADGVPGALTDVRDAIAWAAPEVLDGRSRGSVASDVYSLGAVLWQLLAGAPAATAPSPSGFGATRSTAAAGTVPRPIVTAKRLGASVEFRWRAADVPRAGDSFQWRLPSRGGIHLTTGPSLTIRSPARVCLQVRLARAGLLPSPYAAACG